jgi:Fe-S-cluster containining protein
MRAESQIISDVEAIYRWVDEQAAGMGGGCAACGDCCDFERFGHRLYVTTPEMLYFKHYLGPNVKEMNSGVCPYRVGGKCSIYPYRFSGCRIFQCKGDEQKQNALSEQAIRKLKTVCDTYRIRYEYIYLKTGLEMLQTNNTFNIQQ